MSVAALLKGVESRLRSFAVLSDANGRICGIQPDGKPPPNAGQWYYAIWWPGSRQVDVNPLSHDVDHDINVTITAKMGYAPRDRRGERVTLDYELISRAEAIAATGVIHSSQEVLDLANVLIVGTAEYVADAGSGTPTVNGFVEPLRLLGYGPIREQGSDWVYSDSEHAPTVLTIDVRFGGAKRVQGL